MVEFEIFEDIITKKKSFKVFVELKEGKLIFNNWASLNYFYGFRNNNGWSNNRWDEYMIQRHFNSELTEDFTGIRVPVKYFVSKLKNAKRLRDIYVSRVQVMEKLLNSESLSKEVMSNQ